MNKDIEQGGWKVLKGRMQAQWGKLTDQELEELKGNMQSLAGKIQVYYGKTKQNIEQEIADFRASLKKDNISDDEYFSNQTRAEEFKKDVPTVL